LSLSIAQLEANVMNTLVLSVFKWKKLLLQQRKMAKLLEIRTFADERGELRVLQDQIPFEIKRVYYIHGRPGTERGGHRHRLTDQALVCVSGSCTVSNDDGQKKESFLLDDPAKCLLVDRADWHTMHSFTEGAVLLVLASTRYDVNDYIDEPYPAH
jgi:dTDP-4-dehydrorhamnose 3,5-epimerase-like enzyme